jgi:hypothetical protein
LVVSNVFWAYKLLDAGVSYTYLHNSYEDARGLALQALAILPEVASASVTRQRVIDAAIRARPGSDPFEKEGLVWVGDIGLRFDQDGKFVEARPAVDPF